MCVLKLYCIILTTLLLYKTKKPSLSLTPGNGIITVNGWIRGESGDSTR